jgi:aryl-alcohol dehydrogenase-like predicted oxidoreductase
MVSAFTSSPAIWSMESSPSFYYSSSNRRGLIVSGSSSSIFGGMFGGMFGGNSSGSNSNAEDESNPQFQKRSYDSTTNEIVKQVHGMKYRRLGGGDILVSELGLGTQRWVSTDFNAPSKEDCYDFMDYAILKHGVNLIDTAEQYPIPSDGSTVREGDSERLIGGWMKDRNIARENVVLCTKITGGRNITPRNIQLDCENSLKRLNTNYIDVYQLHWPQRYSPQSNWGQSLAYSLESDRDPYWRRMGGPTSFEDLCISMEKLIQQGKIRGWGLCNDNAYGLTACTRTAKMLGTTPPCSLQGDFSILDRKSEENGVAEAASPLNENVGFMSYNALAGGMLTGKYIDRPAALEEPNRDRAVESLKNPRGRMDTLGWGRTLYRYRSEAAQEAIRDYQTIANTYLPSKSLTELSLRWCRQRSLVTTTLVGHSNMNQLKECISFFTTKEPLSEEIMWEIDRVHMKNRLPIFSSNHVGKDWYGSGEIGETIP